MTQNLISLSFTPEDVTTIDAAVSTLEEKLTRLIELSVDERRGLNKMGDKSEAACRQTLLVLAQNPQILPPSFELAEAQRDLVALDQLRQFSVRIHQLAARLDDTEMALGSDILSAALEGYTFAKAAGKGVALDALRESMASRYSHRRKPSEARNAGA